MRLPALSRACAAFIIAAIVISSTGCAESRPPHLAADQESVEDGVRALLDRWVQSFESRDLAAVRSVLADDERFVWLEDGEVRYQSADAVVGALASFPPGLQFSHGLASVRIVPVSESAAWVQLVTTTEIRQGEQVVSEFTGVVLMLAQREHGEWRIIAAHTSTARPRARSPG